MVPAAAAMRVARALLVGALCAGLAACGVSVSDINARPDKYYQHKVSVTGLVARLQSLPGETLLEVEDSRGSRILVRSTEALEVRTGDWVRVRGLLLPEARVGDTVLYDVISAEHITRTRAPRLRNLM